MFGEKSCNKKGLSGHLEMIISFTLFISFVLFLLAFIRPYDNTNFSDAVLVSIHDSFIENTSVPSTRIFVNHTEPNVRCGLETLPKNFSIENISGVDNAFYILYSEILPSNSLAYCNAKNISLGSVESKRVVFNNSVFLLQQKYDSDYDGLKKDWGISSNVDFSISLGSEYNLDIGAPEDQSIYTRVYDVEVLHTEGAIDKEELIIKTW